MTAGSGAAPGDWPSVPAGGRLVAVAPDLMDRSRIIAARPDVVFLPGPSALAGLGPGDVALVDLGRPAALEAVAASPARVVGFVAHVDEARAAAAVAAGVDEVLARSVFFRRLAAPAGSTGPDGGDGPPSGGR